MLAKNWIFSRLSSVNWIDGKLTVFQSDSLFNVGFRSLQIENLTEFIAHSLRRAWLVARRVSNKVAKPNIQIQLHGLSWLWLVKRGWCTCWKLCQHGVGMNVRKVELEFYKSSIIRCMWAAPHNNNDSELESSRLKILNLMCVLFLSLSITHLLKLESWMFFFSLLLLTTF